jgi:hypothetical protein
VFTEIDNVAASCILMWRVGLAFVQTQWVWVRAVDQVALNRSSSEDRILLVGVWLAFPRG